MTITEDQRASILEGARKLYKLHNSADPGPDCLGEIVELKDREPGDLYQASVEVTGTLADGQQVTMGCLIKLGEMNRQPTAEVFVGNAGMRRYSPGQPM